MSYSVGTHFEAFIKEQIETGRYSNASEIVREGLRLVEEREVKLKALREHVNSAIARGGKNTEQDVLNYVESELSNTKDNNKCA